MLIVALGADYDMEETPGLAESGQEFYSFEGAVRMRDAIRGFSKGQAVIGVCGAPFKCPPAPSECALLLHDQLVARGVRDDCELTLILPFGTPVPPSPETSAALIAAFAERDISFVPGRKVSSLDLARKRVMLDDGTEVPCDLFLGVPKHQAPDVVLRSGLTENGYIPVDPATLATRFPDVYAIGDVATQGTPKAGVFAEGAARALATSLIARLRGAGAEGVHSGTGSCYIEFGGGRIGRVDIDFLTGPDTDRDLSGAVRRAARRQAGVRREPSFSLVRPHELTVRLSRDEKGAPAMPGAPYLGVVEPAVLRACYEFAGSSGASSSTSAMMAAAASAETTCFAILL